jgi:hypothetical protein
LSHLELAWNGAGCDREYAARLFGILGDSSELVIWNRSSLHIDERPKKLKDSADGKGICAGLADRAVFGQARRHSRHLGREL